MKLTEEQKKIIFSKEDNIEVKSPAGSGKTTTLAEYAKENFDKTILCLMFSKDLRKNTKYKMPVNCEVHTANSFAFKYSDFKNRMIVDSFSVIDIMNIFSLNDLTLSSQILSDYNNLMNSDKPLENFPDSYAKQLYFYQINNKVKVDHSFLLKNIAESNISLQYDIIMIDEAQDINPVMKQLIGAITHTKEISIGDINQAIYGFRNNISIFSDNDEYRLTKSFRFGPKIADHINLLTEKLYGKSIDMIGNEKIESIITNKEIVGPYSAYIARTNAHLFNKAIELAIMGLNISIPFEWEDLKNKIKDLVYLQIGMNDKIVNPLYKKFDSFNSLKKYMKNGFNLEDKFLITLIETHNIAMLEYINLIEQRMSSPKYADMTLITAHKSKGLEYMYVEVGTDFNMRNTEEKNLI